MTLTTVLRGFKVSVAVLHAFLAANGLDETFGYPPLDPDASAISALLRTKMGTSGSNAWVVIPQREVYNRSTVAYIAYRWIKVFAQREILLDEDLPEEAPAEFNALREEVSSFAKDSEGSTDGKYTKMLKMGLFVVFTGNLSWLPQELQERNQFGR